MADGSQVRFCGIECDTKFTALHGIEYLIIKENIYNVLSGEKTSWKIVCISVCKYIHMIQNYA